jgi:hypothetical protein
MYPGSKPAKWLFPQEKDTLKTPGKGTLTLVPLYSGSPIAVLRKRCHGVAFPSRKKPLGADRQAHANWRTALLLRIGIWRYILRKMLHQNKSIGIIRLDTLAKPMTFDSSNRLAKSPPLSRLQTLPASFLLIRHQTIV